MAATPLLMIHEGLKSSTILDLPTVLILGDSISIGYTPYVRELLKGKAEVKRPMQADGNPENCNGTTYGLTGIDRWLGSFKWDVIHFNFGLHDMKHVDPATGEGSKNPQHPLQADPDTYKMNLSLLTERLLKTGAKLIFATTTPYADVINPLRDNGMYEKYNILATGIMKENKIPVNDLCRFIRPRLVEFQQPRNVHFTEEGYRVLAGEVAKMIGMYL